jgi:hypothetical protein
MAKTISTRGLKGKVKLALEVVLTSPVYACGNLSVEESVSNSFIILDKREGLVQFNATDLIGIVDRIASCYLSWDATKQKVYLRVY